MGEVLRIASNIATPIGLAGFAIGAFFLILSQAIKANKIPALSGPQTTKLIDRLFLLAAAAVSFAFFAAVYAKPRNLIYQGAVIDAKTHAPINGATVIVLGHLEFYPDTTHEYGSFSLSGNSYESSINADIQISYPNYDIWTQSRTITNKVQTEVITLTPAVTSASISTPAPPARVEKPSIQQVTPPEYEIRSVRVDDKGNPLFQLFTIQTQNLHNSSNPIATGTCELETDGRIYRVDYSCQGYRCGWTYNPNGGYTGSVKIAADGRSFNWFRKWDGDATQEFYKAYYEIQKNVCVRNCASAAGGGR